MCGFVRFSGLEAGPIPWKDMIRAKKNKSHPNDKFSPGLEYPASVLLKRDFEMVTATPQLNHDKVTASANYLTWSFTFTTPVDSLFAGRIYSVDIIFHREYPVEPPVVYMCYTDTTRYNPLPIHVQQNGSLALEEFLPDIWRPMNGIEVLLCVKNTFVSISMTGIYSRIHERICLVSLLTGNSCGQVRMMRLTEYLDVRDLCSLSATCVDLFVAAQSDQVWSHVYFSKIMIPPVSFYAIENFELIRVKSPCNYWRWAGGKDAYLRTLQVDAYLPSNNIDIVAMSEVQLLSIVRNTMKGVYGKCDGGTRLRAALRLLDKTAVVAITKRFQRSLRIVLACFSKDEFLRNLSKPPGNCPSLSSFLQKFCGLSAAVILQARYLCIVHTDLLSEYFSSRYDFFLTTNAYHVSARDILCALCDENQATCRRFAEELTSNIFDSLDQTGCWRIACTSEGKWANQTWDPLIAFRTKNFVNRNCKRLPETPSSHDGERQQHNESVIPVPPTNDVYFALNDDAQESHPRLFFHQLDRHFELQQHLFQGHQPEQLRQLLHQHQLLLEQHLNRYDADERNNMLLAETRLDIGRITTESRKSYAEQYMKYTTLGKSVQNDLPYSLSVHFLGCNDRYDESRRRSAGAPSTIAPFRTKVGLTPTTASRDIRNLVESKVGAVQYPDESTRRHVTMRSLHCSHLPGCGVVRYLICPHVTTVAELYCDFMEIYGHDGVHGIGPITNLRQVGMLKDIKGTIRDAFQVELFYSSENYVDDFTIVNMSCFVSTLIERDMDELILDVIT